MSPHPSIEALESRIAPALFFLSGTAKEVVDKTGASVNDAAAQTLAGSDIAVRLGRGDTLVLDVNGDHLLDAGDTKLLTVLAGSALVFATELGAADGHFDANEITGLAVSDGFQSKLAVDVNGSIVTALNDDGTLAVVGSSLTVQRDSISGLNIAGKVTGNIFAGGDISHVRVTGAVGGNLATGTAVNESDSHLKAPDLSLNGGAKVLAIATFATASSARGGDIHDVQLDHGAKNLLAGNGDDNDLATPGRGGSISNVAITNDSPIPAWIKAGKGGTSNTAVGARGGALTAVTVKLTAAAMDNFRLAAGNGGRGSGAGNGGAGGAIADCTVIATASFAANTVEILGGTGGKAEGTGAGGAGGAITNTAVQLLDAANTIKTLKVAGGAGGESVVGAGGAGGKLAGLTLLAEAVVGDSTAGSAFDVAGGGGGAGKTRGGAGGAIEESDIFLRSDVKAPQPANIHAGAGGALKANATATSIGGKGGAISVLDVTQFADVTAGLTVASGDGGSAVAAGAGRGGAGGAFTAAISVQGGTNTALIAQAGKGGASPTGSGDGGAGGGIAKTTVAAVGALKSLLVQAGAGADANATADGRAGAGGAIKTLRVTTGDVTSQVKALAGAGGKSSGYNSGAGGAISGLAFQNTGNLAGGLLVTGGAGGAASGEGGGGTGGAILDSTFINTGGTVGFEVRSGVGGDAARSGKGGAGGGIARLTLESFASLGTDPAITSGAGGKGGTNDGGGGAGGKISGLTLHVLESALAITAGSGGASSTSKSGGAGGAIDGVGGAVDTAKMVAGSGGNSTSGTGGAGGAIKHIDLDVVGTFVRALLAGNGGNGSVAGAGGSVSGVFVAGDIGDFAHNFDLTGATGMGGIAAGQAGKAGGTVAVTKNGSITSITATRIAAMIAGTPAANAVTSANAVLKIAKITADAIGADVNGDGDFDPAGFGPGSALTAEDGFILVRAGGLTLPAALVPLKVFAV